MVRRNLKGFTLIELLVVMAIIGILAGIVVVSVNPARARARDTKRKADLKTLQNALESYYYKNQKYVLQNTSPGTMCVSYWARPSNTPPYLNWDCNGTDGTGGTVNEKRAMDDLVANNYLPSLPVDPINKNFRGNALEGGYSGYEDNRGYLYYSKDGKGYILGTNLEQDRASHDNSDSPNTEVACGKTQLRGGTQQTCSPRSEWVNPNP